MQLLLLLTALWASDAAPDAPADLSCETVAQCWLDPAGNAIRRPQKYAGRPLPHGDCSGKLVWARHRLLCLRHRCQSIPMADMCLMP
jgi:hypothetical protein